MRAADGAGVSVEGSAGQWIPASPSPYWPRDGVDWLVLRTRYQALIDSAVTRWDVNFVLRDFIGELNGRTPIAAAATSEGAQRGSACSGSTGRSRTAPTASRASPAGAWDTDARSPLATRRQREGGRLRPGREWRAARHRRDPLAAFQGLAGKTAILTVNGPPSTAGARQATVCCLGTNPSALPRVDRGAPRSTSTRPPRPRRLHLRADTGIDGQNELLRQFMAQWRKDALIIDERWNSGGQIPDRFIELLNRPMLAYWAVRARRGLALAAGRAPRAEGDAHQRLERFGRRRVPVLLPRGGLGPLIGTRTWGGLIGLAGPPELIDGGDVTVPTFRIYDLEGSGSLKASASNPTSASTKTRRAGQRPRSAARTCHRRSDGPAEDGAAGAGASQ